MKILKQIPVVIFVLLLASCQKEEKAVTRPVEFTEANYQSLGTFDATGRPNNLVTPDVVSSEMASFINSNLPEQQDLRTSHPELLSSTAIGDITITQQSDVFITFVSQGTAFSNALAFYTYPTSTPPASAKDIKGITYFFPNAGFGTPLYPGDKVKLGKFNPGTSIGFVLLKGAWDATAPTKLDNKAVHFCSNDVLNPEVDPTLKKHAVLINYPAENKLLIGFEDLDRTTPQCDHDFNDVIVYATVVP